MALFDPIRTGGDIWNQWPGGKQPAWENTPMIGPDQQRFRTEYLDLLRQYSGKQQQYGEEMWPRFRGMVDDPMATLGQYLPQMESQFFNNSSSHGCQFEQLVHSYQTGKSLSLCNNALDLPFTRPCLYLFHSFFRRFPVSRSTVPL